MAILNEVARMQKLAGIRLINEGLTSKEQKVVDDILSECMLEESKYDPKKILDKLIQAGKKGLLTATILSTVLASCNFNQSQEDSITRGLRHAKEEDELQWKRAGEEAGLDSAKKANQGEIMTKDFVDSMKTVHWADIVNKKSKGLD